MPYHINPSLLFLSRSDIRVSMSTLLNALAEMLSITGDSRTQAFLLAMTMLNSKYIRNLSSTCFCSRGAYVRVGGSSAENGISGVAQAAAQDEGLFDDELSDDDDDDDGDDDDGNVDDNELDALEASLAEATVK